MASCNMCRNGWTALGNPCPNGCREKSLRKYFFGDAPLKAMEMIPIRPENFAWNPFPPGVVLKEPFSAETLLDILRLLSAITIQIPQSAKNMPPMKLAHLEWCNAAMDALHEEHPEDPPHVLLNRALAELQQIVEAVMPTQEQKNIEPEV